LHIKEQNPDYSQSMNILYNHRTMGRGAEGLHIVSIVRALEKLGHKVTVVSPPGIDPMKNFGSAPLDKSKTGATRVKGLNRTWKWVSKHAPQILFEFLEILYNYRAWKALKARVKNHSIDAVYERYAFFLFAGGLFSKKHNIPYIIEANEVSGIPRARPQILQRLAAKIERKNFKRAASVLTVSSFLKQKMMEANGCNPDSIVVMPNAIDPERFQGTRRRNQIRKQYGISNAIVFGFAGWFDAWDRLDFLLDTFEMLRARNQKVALLLVGDGANSESLERSIAEKKLAQCVHMTGVVPHHEVLHYLDAIDVAVLPHSNSFGSPIVLFEFMALGKPMVVPRLAPLTDVVTHGENGLIFEPLNTEQCLQCMEQLAGNRGLIEQLGTTARQNTFERHTWEQHARSIEKIILSHKNA